MCNTVDFNTDGDGNSLRGTTPYVGTQWESSHGLVVSALSSSGGGYTPHGQARLYDSSYDAPNNDQGDPDLGTPNAECGGPGRGNGGRPGQPGENCVALGNLVIVQESDKPYADDNARGGTLVFGFTNPRGVHVESMGLVDIGSSSALLEIITTNAIYTQHLQALGDNSYQVAIIDRHNVLEVRLHLSGGGAVSHVAFCNPSCETTTSIGLENHPWFQERLPLIEAELAFAVSTAIWDQFTNNPTSCVYNQRTVASVEIQLSTAVESYGSCSAPTAPLPIQ